MIVNVVSRALERAVQAGTLPRNPTKLVELPPVSDYEPRVLTDAEVAAILRALLGQRLAALYHLLICLGLRRKEVLELAWRDLHLDTDDARLVIRKSKTRAGRRTLPLAAAVQRKVIVREVEPRWVAIAERNAAHIQARAGMFAGKVDVSQHDARQPWGYPCDHIICSPTYGNSISARNVTRNRATTLERLRRKHAHFQTERFRELLAAHPMSGALAAEDFCYGESPDQVGHLRGAAYWEAMRPIYQQARAALNPGGVLIVIIKDHIADGERVCIADETVRVCGDVGFRLVERHQRVLTTFALWTRRRKEQGLPVVEEEDVLVFQ